jgi:hypothetical protein
MSEPTRHVSKTGGAKDLKIERYDQIPAGPLAELAARFGVGNLKYEQRDGLDNWRHGYPWSWSYRALIGHANDFWAGEDIDPAAYAGTDDPRSLIDGVPRPGVRHLAAVAWHAFALLEWAETHPELDDRPSTVIARNAAGLSSTEDPDGQRAADFEDGWKAALRHVGESDDTPAPLTEWATSEPKYDVVQPLKVSEGGKVYPLLELYRLVTVHLEDGREIQGAITGIKVVDDKVRYDVTYDGGLGRLSFVPPAQITAE